MLRKPFPGWVLIALVSAQFAAGSALAVPDGRDFEEEERDHVQSDLWVPTLSLAVTVHNEELDMVADNPIAFDFETTESRTLATIRFGADLMTPTFENLPFEPRFSLSLGVLWSPPGNGFARDRHETEGYDDYRSVNLAQQLRAYDALELSNPPVAAVKSADEFTGQGNRIRSRQRHNAWYVGVGSVFTFPRSSYTLRVRPSLEYVGEQLSTKGQFRLVTDVDPLNLDPLVSRFAINEIKLKSRQTHHNVGPGLELELINHLDGNFTLSFFLQTRFLWVVDSPKLRMKGKTNAGRDVTYEVARQRFNFRGGLGFRLGFRNLAFDI